MHSKFRPPSSTSLTFRLRLPKLIVELEAALRDVTEGWAEDDRERVFEIATHKVEYVEELQAVRDRHLLNRSQCLRQVEHELAQARQLGLIDAAQPLRSVALGLHALMDGLIQNWLLDPEAFNLEQVGRHVLCTYLQGLRVRPAVPV